ncbi:Protein LURP-one-related 8 [Zea mays]|uniref:Protein LURP-one-related 8 n=1 Tax=Zea mays TaxID=4577 RepID=A0A3L6FGZ9_MAIZE|nr:Protein LURP-one-related 8 [Zea mays]
MPKTKVHPNAAAAEPVLTVSTACARADPVEEEEEPPTVLTVWRKSLLFNCDGFTVYDARGDLAFRVDSYDATGRRRAEVVLMDGAGTPLLTVRRKRRLGVLAEHWVIYDGDAAAEAKETPSRPLLSVRRHRASSSSSKAKAKALAHVTPLPASSSSLSGYRRATAEASYVMEGSYGRRACVVRDRAHGDAVVAEVSRKEAAVGDDVFRLVADPRLGATLAMGLVIALDEMFARGRSTN